MTADYKCPWCGGECEYVGTKGEARRDLACVAWAVCGWVEGGEFLR